MPRQNRHRAKQHRTESCCLSDWARRTGCTSLQYLHVILSKQPSDLTEQCECSCSSYISEHYSGPTSPSFPLWVNKQQRYIHHQNSRDRHDPVILSSHGRLNFYFKLHYHLYCVSVHPKSIWPTSRPVTFTELHCCSLHWQQRSRAPWIKGKEGEFWRKIVECWVLFCGGQTQTLWVSIQPDILTQSISIDDLRVKLINHSPESLSLPLTQPASAEQGPYKSTLKAAYYEPCLHFYSGWVTSSGRSYYYSNKEGSQAK